MENILKEIQNERKRQNEEWGEQNHTPIEWVSILTEEVGEVAKEAVDYHFKNPVKNYHAYFPSMEQAQEDRIREYRKELIQVAAVAVQMIECLDRNSSIKKH